MRILVLLPFLLALFIQISSQNFTELESKAFENLRGRKLNKFEELNELTHDNDNSYFMMLYHTESKNSRKGAIIASSITKTLTGIVEFIHYDCTGNKQNIDFCHISSNSTVESFPRFYMIVPPEYRTNPYTKKFEYHRMIDYKEKAVNDPMIYKFITDNIIQHSVSLHSGNIDEFLENESFNKVILFTDKPKTPLLWRALSNKYYDRILIGEVKNTEKEILSRFGLFQMPVILNYITHDKDLVPLNEPELEVFHDDYTLSGKLQNFIERNAFPEKKWVASKQGKPLVMKRTPFRNSTLEELENTIGLLEKRRIILHISERGILDKEALDFIDKTNGFFTFINVNCSGTLFQCQEAFKINRFPSIVSLPKEGNYTTKCENAIEISYKDMGELLLDFMSIEKKGRLIEGLNQTISQIHSEAKRNNKFPILYLFNQTNFHPSVYLITTEEKYTKHFDFVAVKNPHEELMKQLALKELPKALILVQDMNDPKKNVNIVALQGQINYINMKKFCDTFIQKHISKTQNVYNTYINPADQFREDIAWLNDTKSFREGCSRKKKPCVISFLDGRTNNKKALESFTKSFEEIDKALLSPKTERVTFNWVNATCQTDLARRFNIQPEFLPNLVIYNPRKGEFSSLIGTFSGENILNFILDYEKGRVPTDKVTLIDADFKKINCEKLQDVKEEYEEDPILREIVEEEKKKREQFEKERDQAMKKKKKGKRKAKKPVKTEDL